ncbi:hypothetical protein GCM10029992_56900 [Glycomyces albus]
MVVPVTALVATIALVAPNANAQSDRYEAEDAPATCDGTIESNHSGYSGSGFCDTPNEAGAAAQFTVTAHEAGEATVEIGFANGSSSGARGADVEVNGTTATSVSFEVTGGWSTWATKTVIVSLDEGDNTIDLIATGSEGLPNIDYLDHVTPPPPPIRYEAEEAPAVCDGTIESNHSGYSGSGFCDTPNEAGTAAQFTVTAHEAGEATVEIGFANGSSSGARGADVEVNGTTATSVSFEVTGGWSSWTTKTLTVSLDQGVNTIDLVAAGSGGLPNIDYLDLTMGGNPPQQDARPMEDLGRGVVAVRSDNSVLVSWRLLGLDPDDIGFNVYRSTDGVARSS